MTNILDYTLQITEKMSIMWENMLPYIIALATLLAIIKLIQYIMWG